MASAARIVSALVVLGAAAGAIAVFGPGDSGRAGGPRRFESSAQCRDCHVDVYREWESSHHRIAYTNPEVRKLSDDFRNKECQACHLPRPILETGVGDRPLQRQSRPTEGVDCLTCHLDERGRIVGNRDIPTAGCAPVRDERLVSIDLCKSCHNQHQTTDQYLASEWPKRGVHCNDCHMPEAERDAERKGRSHVYPGCHDIEYLRKAAKFRVRVEGREAIVEVENDGAGHNFPTEERHRCVDVMYRFVDADGLEGEEPAFTQLYRFRQPYRGDPGPNTQLPAHETWSGKIPFGERPSGSVLQVRLLYRLQPFLSDDEAMMLFERTVAVP